MKIKEFKHFINLVTEMDWCGRPENENAEIMFFDGSGCIVNDVDITITESGELLLIGVDSGEEEPTVDGKIVVFPKSK